MAKCNITTAAVIFASLMFAPLAAYAEDLSTQQMIDALQPKKKGLTRSLTGKTPETSPEDQQFIDGLKGTTRAIVVEERKKLVEVVEKYDMPKFDMEIYFDFNSSNIAQPAIPSLIKLGQALTDPLLAQQSIIVSGHTDAVGSDGYNQKLSEARAQSVKAFLVDNFQVDPQRLIAVGYGEEQLKNAAMPDADENRRVTVVNVTM
ncbi:OmpA family protein [Aestuariivirga sp.]|jgi:outer membrane protein OmpA-like peptidoglycan-associated protein|uniref:OmpA family protein n=1 Tax=Aestuariivirga sp. TaxID=2650926 RepID=UPI0037836847